MTAKEVAKKLSDRSIITTDMILGEYKGNREGVDTFVNEVIAELNKIGKLTLKYVHPAVGEVYNFSK